MSYFRSQLVLSLFLSLFLCGFTNGQPNQRKGPSDRRRVPIPVEQVSGSIIQGSYIIEMCDASSASADEFAQYIIGSSGSQSETDIKGRFGGRGSFRPHLSLSNVNERALGDLREMEMVCSVEPDQVVTISATRSWGIDRIDQACLPLDGSFSQENQLTGAGTTVYVLDTGIYPSHSEFGGRAITGWCAPGLCACAGECTLSQQSISSDGNGHGTHCAGTAVGESAGVAPGAAVVGVKVCTSFTSVQVKRKPRHDPPLSPFEQVLSDGGSGSWSGVIEGMEWARDHSERGQEPAVISMSLGGGASTAMDSAVNSIVSDGLVVVVAAGNGNTDACFSSPARAASALTIGATTSVDALASYTNYGPCVDLYAPGSSITSAQPNGGYSSFSGTSMACPHVAGAAALYLQDNPTASPSQIETKIKDLAVKGLLSGGSKCSAPNCDLLQVNPPGSTNTMPPLLTFEETLCGLLSSGGELPWTLRSGSTPSSNTGPGSDHTTGSGSYYFTETSSPRNPGDVFVLQGNSPPGNLEFTFAYHMFGSSMGTLHFEVSSNGGASWTSHWSKTGNQANQWHQASPIVINQIDTFRFRGVRGSSWQSDMAIDDLAISFSDTPGTLPPTSFPTGVTPEPTIAPNEAPTTSPTETPPTSTPVTSPTSAPVASPTSAPVTPPTTAPTETPPTSTPVTSPTSAPVASPTSAPITPPTSTPVAPPTPQTPPSLIFCNFEESDCDLQAASLPWILRSGNTPSSSTGPSGDHTTGNGNYFYTEATGQSSGSVYLLEAALPGNVPGNLQSVSFYYHMYGNAMGEMHFEVSSDAGTSWAPLWSKAGNQGNQWSQMAIGPINQQIDGFRFRSIRGSGFLGFRSDMAIDDLQVVLA